MQTRVGGAAQAVGGFAQVAAAVYGTAQTGGTAGVALAGLGTLGVDNAFTGLKQMVTGKSQQTMLNQSVDAAAQLAGADEHTAAGIAAAVEVVANVASMIPEAQVAAELNAFSRTANAATMVSESANPKTIGSMLKGQDGQSMIHLTNATPDELAKSGVWADSSWVKLDDVAHMTLPEYQSTVVGRAAAASPGQPVSNFAVSKPGAATFEATDVPNLSNTVEYTNPKPVIPDENIPVTE